jgi:hypothetical protein
MRKGFKVSMAWDCEYFNNVLVVTNFTFTNQVILYPMIDYSIDKKNSTDVGMWRVKQLKN